MTRLWGGLTVVHLFSGTVLWCLPMSQVRFHSPCEYENGYLIFDNNEGDQEIWRLASDLVAEGEVAAAAPPDNRQIAVSAHAAEVYHYYAPRGQFRPWALLRPPENAWVYRLVYPTLICASREHAFLYDVRTGLLMQTVNINLRTLRRHVDVNQRHIFVCELDMVHVFSLESGSEVLRIPADAIVRCTSQRVEDPFLIAGDWFITPLSVSAEVDECPRPEFIAAKVSRDGRDLVILSEDRIVFIRDFERICLGETTFQQATLVLGIPPEDKCRCLGFEHGRVCVATIQGLYIFIFGPDRSARAVFVRLYETPPERSGPITSMQVTDRRIYLTWGDSKLRQDIPLFEDAEDAAELGPPPPQPLLDLEFEVPPIMGIWNGQHGPFESKSLGCIDFS